VGCGGGICRWEKVQECDRVGSDCVCRERVGYVTGSCLGAEGLARHGD
jgi:hypothetical protein